MIGDVLKRATFFLGWLLSPLTSWNDIFLNIPIAYLLANLAKKFTRSDFTLLLIICYWLTNVAGLVMMFLSGRSIISGRDAPREILKMLLIMFAYSIAMLVIGRAGAIKPVF